MGKKQKRKDHRRYIPSILSRCRFSKTGCYYFLNSKNQPLERSVAYFRPSNKDRINVTKILYEQEYEKTLKRSVNSCGDKFCVSPHHIVEETIRSKKSVEGQNECIPAKN